MWISPGNCVAVEVMMGNQKGWGTGLHPALLPNPLVCLCGVQYFPTLPMPAAPPACTQTSNREKLPTLLKKATPWKRKSTISLIPHFSWSSLPSSVLSQYRSTQSEEAGEQSPEQAGEHHTGRTEKEGRGDTGKEGHEEARWGGNYFEILKMKSSIMCLYKIKFSPCKIK